MYVGDGTWDSTRNNFLLPNLVGLNFETMQYNGIFPLLYVRKDILIFFFLKEWAIDSERCLATIV